MFSNHCSKRPSLNEASPPTAPRGMTVQLTGQKPTSSVKMFWSLKAFATQGSQLLAQLLVYLSFNLQPWPNEEVEAAYKKYKSM